MLKKIDYKMLISIVLTMLIFIYRDVMLVPVSDMVLTFCITTMMVLLPFHLLVYYIFFIFPFTCGIPGYIMTISFLLLMMKGRKITRMQLVPLIIVALLEFFTEGMKGMDTITGMMSFLSFLAVFFYFLNDRNKVNYDRSQCVIWFSLGVAFTLFVIYYNVITQYGLLMLVSGSVRSGALGVEGNNLEVMKGHLAMNANSIAYYSICSLTSLIVILRFLKRKKIVYLLIVLVFLCGILSFSRTYILAVVLFFLLFTFLADNKSRGKMTMSILIVFLIGFFFTGNYLLEIIQAMTERSEEMSISTAGGRTGIFSSYNKAWLSNPLYVLFGCGAVDYRTTLNSVDAMHCGLQQIWVCLGISGFFLFAWQIVTYLKHYIKRRYLIYSLPFLTSFVFDQSLQFLNPYSLIVPILAPLLVCQVWGQNNVIKLEK